MKIIRKLEIKFKWMFIKTGKDYKKTYDEYGIWFINTKIRPLGLYRVFKFKSTTSNK